jgi:protein-S-isoprenylcysteine O-methyltransferase Ste14
LPSGTLFAHFFKHRPNGLWFKIHRGCQTLGLLIALAGWIYALKNFNVFMDVGFSNYRHGILGSTTMVLGLLQPINATLRPHPPKEDDDATTARLLWEFGHKSIGYLAVLLAIVTIGYGTTVLPNPDDQKTFQMAYGIGVGGVLLLILVALNIDKRNYKEPEEPTKKVDEEEQSPLAE